MRLLPLTILLWLFTPIPAPDVVHPAQPGGTPTTQEVIQPRDCSGVKASERLWIRVLSVSSTKRRVRGADGRASEAVRLVTARARVYSVQHTASGLRHGSIITLRYEYHQSSAGLDRKGPVMVERGKLYSAWLNKRRGFYVPPPDACSLSRVYEDDF